MAYTINSIDDLLLRVTKKLDISEVLFQDAKSQYDGLSKCIEKETEFLISVYPQGSFALGTVIKPISDKDDYDLDVVCELNNKHNFTAEELKFEVKNWLKKYREIERIENKRRCWHVEYKGLEQFHMDVIPAYNDIIEIFITNHDEELDLYRYIKSNPKGYKEWFFKQAKKQSIRLYEQYCKDNNIVYEEMNVEELDRQKYKNTLQQTVQLLKRHRDILYKDNPEDKPTSIIITTLSAYLYDNNDSILASIIHILNNMESYVFNNMENGEYKILNPTCSDENYAEKWNTNPKRRDEFFKWLKQAKNDFSFDRLSKLDRIGIGKEIKRLFGENLGVTIFNEIAEEERKSILNENLKVNTSTGSLSKEGNITVPKNRHYGSYY